MIKRVCRWTFVATCVSVLLADATSADTDQRAAIYPAGYFADLNVLTARDMVNRIPGSEAELANVPSGGAGQRAQRRGLRDQTDRFLINGKRFTGKANDTNEFLERLPADRVVRIEVIDGIVAENESDAASRTINIVTTGDKRLSGTLRLGMKWAQDHRTTFVGDANMTARIGDAQVNLGFETTPNGSLTHRYDTTYVLETPTEYAVEERLRYAHRNRATGSVNIGTGRNSTLLLNALHSWQPRRGTNFVDDFNIEADGSLSPVSASEEPLERDVVTTEIGGTWEYSLREGGRFEVLFLKTKRDNDRESKKSVVFGNGSTELNRELREQTEEETVLRGTWFAGDVLGGDLDIGLELAVNELDKAVALFEGSAPPLDPVPIPNADQVIREDRAEAFLNWSRVISRLQYRLGLAVEYSEFDQQGSDVSQQRTLDFVKPSVNVSFVQAADLRWFLVFKRDVSQLDFDDFVASIDPVDREIRAGNPDLSPETSWDLEAGVEKHLRGDAGLVKLRVFHRWVQDVKDLVPLGPDDYQPGNLDDGRHWGVGLTVGLRMDSIGLDGAVLNANYLWQDSETVDPFTGAARRFLSQERYEGGIDFRHDLRRFRGAYGVKWSFEGDRMRHEHDRVDTDADADVVEVFVEKKIGTRLILRMALNQLAEPERTRHRRSFDPDRATGIEVSTTDRIQVLRRFATLTLSGSF